MGSVWSKKSPRSPNPALGMTMSMRPKREMARLKRGKLAVPVGGVGGVVVVVWGGDGDGWGLEVADEDVAAGGVQVGGDALPDAGGAAGYEGGFAAEFVAWGVEGGCVSS